jgi:hypothetical protein
MLTTIIALQSTFLQNIQPVSKRLEVRTVIIRAENVNAGTWKTSRRKAERLFIDREGQKILLRTIEHE